MDTPSAGERPPDAGGPYVIECACPAPPNPSPRCPPCPAPPPNPRPPVERVPIERPPEPIGYPQPPRGEKKDALAGALVVEGVAQGAWTDLEGADGGFGGGLGLRISILGHAGSLTYRAIGNGALGYLTTGFMSRFAGDASVGPALSLGPSSRLFARVGLEAASHRDGELDVSVYTFPSAFVGLQVTTDALLFELGPRAGATLRAIYAPGDENAGARHHRHSRVAPSWGGSAALVSPYLLLDASLTRVEESPGLWHGVGSTCVVVPPPESDPQGFVLCGTGQYGRGRVEGPAGEEPDVASWVVGASFGFGFFDVKRRP